MTYPLIRPVTEPFLLTVEKGDYFEESFDSYRDGIVSLATNDLKVTSWTDISGIVTSAGKLYAADGTGGNVLTREFNAGNVFAEAEYNLFTSLDRLVIIAVRISSSSIGDSYFVVLTPTSITIERVIGWSETGLASVSITNPKNGFFRAEANGGLISAWVNDKKVLEVADTQWSSGGIGLLINSAEILNFRVGRL